MRRGPAILALLGLVALGTPAEQFKTKQDELVFEDADKAKKKP